MRQNLRNIIFIHQPHEYRGCTLDFTTQTRWCQNFKLVGIPRLRLKFLDCEIEPSLAWTKPSKAVRSRGVLGLSGLSSSGLCKSRQP